VSRQTRIDTATEVVDSFRRIVQLLRSSARRAERELGVSGAQLFVLQQLAEGPTASLNELARRTLTHQSSVSVVVSRLVQRGLATRDRSPLDGRRIELNLTRAGRRLLRDTPSVPQMQLVEAVLRLPRSDLKALARLLRKLAEATGASRVVPAMFGDDATDAGRRRRSRLQV
jgi:DNA-binding MarR family transcriptional regulator